MTELRKETFKVALGNSDAILHLGGKVLSAKRCPPILSTDLLSVDAAGSREYPEAFALGDETRASATGSPLPSAQHPLNQGDRVMKTITKGTGPVQWLGIPPVRTLGGSYRNPGPQNHRGEETMSLGIQLRSRTRATHGWAKVGPQL